MQASSDRRRSDLPAAVVEGGGGRAKSGGLFYTRDVGLHPPSELSYGKQEELLLSLRQLAAHARGLVESRDRLAPSPLRRAQFVQRTFGQPVLSSAELGRVVRQLSIEGILRISSTNSDRFRQPARSTRGSGHLPTNAHATHHCDSMLPGLQ